MASRFVSGGTIGATGETETKKGQQSRTPPQAETAASKDKNVEWDVAQRELEEERRQRDEARAKAAHGGEKSLYEILQANKAAKQEAFEEQHRLRNQFRALDEDEIAFLDEVRQRQAREEEAVRRATEQGLREFRQRQRGEAGGGGDVAVAAASEAAVEDWAVSRKRRRVAKENEAAHKAARKSVVGEGGEMGSKKSETDSKKSETDSKKSETDSKKSETDSKTDKAADKRSETDNTTEKAGNKKGAAVALVAYASDDSDDSDKK